MNYTSHETYSHCRGEIEIEIRDRHGRILQKYVEPNLIKIFAKEMLAHRLGYSKIWDPGANSGTGDWMANTVDPDEEFAAKYILLGASFDEDGLSLGNNDPRYYELDSGTGVSVPRKVNVGADNMGGLINAIPISEPNRPLKRIEDISFRASYQPSDSPLLTDDVRAVNNIVVLETVLRLDEYNGFGTTGSDFFTITEVALAGGKSLGSDIGACECLPQFLFLEGVDGEKDQQIAAIANGSSTISIDPAVDAADVNRIKEGDQIFIVAPQSGSEDEYGTLDQVNQYYLATSKTPGGRDIVLDRTPVDENNAPLTGNIGIYRSTLRLFSHRILSTPFKKSIEFELVVRWVIRFN